MRTTAVVMLIILAAILLNFVLAVIRLTQPLTAYIEGLGMGPAATMVIIIIFCIILGCFTETFSMLLTITPLIAPIVFSLGYDPVWWGIVITVLLETALITPPIGVYLYVVQGVRGRGSMNDVMSRSLPFGITMFVMIVLPVLFPQIALFLPGLFYYKSGRLDDRCGNLRIGHDVPGVAVITY